MDASSRKFPELSRAALKDEILRDALVDVEQVMPHIRREAFAALPEYEALTERARDIKDQVLRHLDFYLQAFEKQVQSLGGVVHWAQDAAEARAIVAGIARDKGVRRVTKSKSMVSEEIDLNAGLEAAGLELTETDLGEYIIQLRGEKPSHILAPALHVSLEEVAATFEAQHDIERTKPLGDADEMLAEARMIMRQKFLDAEMGITGANFLIAETGGVVIVTNEGNADLTAGLPDTHVVVTGIEKLVPTFEDTGVMLRLLARSAIGQGLSNYTTFIHGPRQQGERSGPQELHVVLVDNGRSELLGGEFQEMLRCIRCSACINHCPVYTAVGGHAYGSVYSGPMGAVLTPGLAGLRAAKHLPNASTFCGRCAEVCPVKIPLPKLLRHWREREYAQHLSAPLQRFGLTLWSVANRSGFLYSRALGLAQAFVSRLAGEGGWIKAMPAPFGGWFVCRDLKVESGGTFQRQWRKRQEGAE
ncbi:MAG: LutB/LldF family L-lactate oxidation iron-sulfur protein [Gammaproteobacteria bacterium]